jgi:hypothetical protein
MRTYQRLPAAVVKTSFWLSPDLLEEAKAAATEEGVTLRTWLTTVIVRALARRRPKAQVA